jgi:hypothetical protein
MLRVSPRTSFGGQESERITMGNLAVAEELAGSDELEELYRLDASETGPEEDEDGEEEEEEEEDEGEAEPHGIPHGIPH